MMKIVVLFVIILPILLFSIVFYYSDEIGKKISDYVDHNIDTINTADGSFYLHPQSDWGPSPPRSNSISITFENSFDRPVRVFWVDFEGKLVKYGTIASHDEMSISTYPGHQWVLNFSDNNLTGIYIASNQDCVAKIDSLSRRVAMKESLPNESSESGKINMQKNIVKFQVFSSNGKIHEGQFVKEGSYWIEYPKNANYSFKFLEVKRDKAWIHLHDNSRNFSAKLPLERGQMLLRTEKSFYKYLIVQPIWE
jgi:hypothetical protein